MTFRAGAPEPPLNVAHTILADANGNGAIDYNETNRLWIVLRNDGVATATNVTGTLSTVTPGATVVQPAASYPNAAPGQWVTNLEPFVFYTAPGFVCGTPLQFTNLAACAGRTTTNLLALASGSSAPPARADNSNAVPIPDKNKGVAFSTNFMAGFSGTLAQVIVSLYITHTYDGDLVIDLISPDHTTNNLVSRQGGVGDNFGAGCSPEASRTSFDDTASQSITRRLGPLCGGLPPAAAAGRLCRQERRGGERPLDSAGSGHEHSRHRHLAVLVAAVAFLAHLCGWRPGAPGGHVGQPSGRPGFCGRSAYCDQRHRFGG